jgi:hypothetical protein
LLGAGDSGVRLKSLTEPMYSCAWMAAQTQDAHWYQLTTVKT